MYKIIVATVFIVFAFGAVNNISAKSEKAEKEKEPKNIYKIEIPPEQPTKEKSKPLRVSRSVVKELKVTLIEENTHTVDAEVLKAVEEIEQKQKDSEKVLDDSFNKVESRPAFIKFIIGPDYKNAGQIRSELVKLQNEVKQLTKMKENFPEEARPEVDEAIASLNTEIAIIQTRLDNALGGFSLIGWLKKLLSPS